MNVIIDTSGWYALFVPWDRFHLKAKKFFASKPQPVTSSIIFEEVLALLHSRQGKKLAVEAGKVIRTVCADNFWYLGKEDYEDIFTRYNETKQAIDFVDVSILWLSERARIPVFTFDSHFKKMGLTVVP